MGSLGLPFSTDGHTKACKDKGSKRGRRSSFLSKATSWQKSSEAWGPRFNFTAQAPHRAAWMFRLPTLVVVKRVSDNRGIARVSLLLLSTRFEALRQATQSRNRYIGTWSPWSPWSPWSWARGSKLNALQAKLRAKARHLAGTTCALSTGGHGHGCSKAAVPLKAPDDKEVLKSLEPASLDSYTACRMACIESGPVPLQLRPTGCNRWECGQGPLSRSRLTAPFTHLPRHRIDKLNLHSPEGILAQWRFMGSTPGSSFDPSRKQLLPKTGK